MNVFIHVSSPLLQINTMLKKIAFLTLVSLWSVGVFSQNNEDALFIKKIHDFSLTESQCHEWLRQLTTEAGQRLAGSPTYKVAEILAKDFMEEAGLANIQLQECEVRVWKRGIRETAYITDSKGSKKYLHVTSLGNTIGTGFDGIEAPVVVVQTLEEVDNMADGALEGKIVFYNRPMDPRQLRTFNAYGGAVDQRGRGLVSAASKGAIAVLVRSMTLAQDDVPHSGSAVYRDGVKQIPAMGISTNDSDMLAELVKSKPETLLFMRNTCYFDGTAMDHSVIGEIKGSEHPEKIIVVGGHLDAWDMGDGAHDDGAGCVQALEVLNTLKKLGYQPKNTIRCVMFANEENGLAGGRKYGEYAAQNKNEVHIAALESDAGGFIPKEFSFDADASVLEKYMKVVHPWFSYLEPYNLQYETGGSGADISPLKPTKALLIGLRPDSQRYFDFHHTTADTFGAVHRRELQLGAAAMTSLVYLIDKYGLE